VVNIDAASRVPMLAAGKVQSIDQFLMSEPAIRRAVTTAKPVCLFAGDYGLEIYANSLGVSEDFLAKNPEVVKKFTRAALKGWKDALANPEEAAKIEIQYVKALDPQIVVEEIAILKRIAITPDVEKNGFGYVSPERMKNTVDFINKNIEVSGDKLTADQIYRPGYLPETPIKPKRGSSPRAGTTIVAVSQRGFVSPKLPRGARALLSCPGRASVSERRPGTQELHGKIDRQLKRVVVSPWVPGLASLARDTRANSHGACDIAARAKRTVGRHSRFTMSNSVASSFPRRVAAPGFV